MGGRLITSIVVLPARRRIYYTVTLYTCVYISLFYRRSLIYVVDDSDRFSELQLHDWDRQITNVAYSIPTYLHTYRTQRSLYWRVHSVLILYRIGSPRPEHIIFIYLHDEN